MKTIFRTVIYLLSAAIFVASGSNAQAGETKQTPLTGSFRGQENDVPQGFPPQTLAVHGTVMGIAPHLGRFTMIYYLTVTLANGTSTGTGQLIAADGSTITGTVTGSSAPGEPGIAIITEVYMITGGTGRFTGASGTFTVQRLVDLMSGSTSGTIQGVVIAPNGAH